MLRLSKSAAAKLGVTVPKSPGKRGMNKLEARYAAHLATLNWAGEILGFGFEEIKLKIGANRCWFTPDFHVIDLSGRLCFHETKGFMRDDARVKLQSAAKQYPQFRFVLVRAAGNGWDVETVA